jgi:hypothetical protein
MYPSFHRTFDNIFSFPKAGSIKSAEIPKIYFKARACFVKMRNLIPSLWPGTEAPLLFLSFCVRPPPPSGFVGPPPENFDPASLKDSRKEFPRGKLSRGVFEIIFVYS